MRQAENGVHWPLFHWNHCVTRQHLCRKERDFRRRVLCGQRLRKSCRVTVSILENYSWISIFNAKRLILGQWTGFIGEEEDHKDHKEDGVAGSEVSPAAFVRIQTSWDTTLCHCVKVSWHIERTLYLPLQRSSCPRWITECRTEVRFQPRIRTGMSPWPALGPTQPPIQWVPGLSRG
jgi:hypothetical protein